MELRVWEDESTQDSARALVDGYIVDIPVGAIIIDGPPGIRPTIGTSRCTQTLKA